METGGEKVLNHSYDVRGQSGRILRLYSFDKEGFLHMLFYRILIFISIIAAIYIIVNLADPALGTFGLYFMIFIVWILLTPQIFESAKVFSIMQTKAKIFGHLEESFLKSSQSEIPATKRAFYWSIPYFILILWLIGLFVYTFKVLI